MARWSLLEARCSDYGTGRCRTILAQDRFAFELRNGAGYAAVGLGLITECDGSLRPALWREKRLAAARSCLGRERRKSGWRRWNPPLDTGTPLAFHPDVPSRPWQLHWGLRCGVSTAAIRAHTR